MVTLRRRTGIEVELLAPPGSDRAALAQRVADDVGGSVSRFFHTDSEPSLVPGMGHFWHLTPGFTVHDAQGAPLASLVDDITLVADLLAERVRDGDGGGGGRPGDVGGPRARGGGAARGAARRGGWYRLLSDEPRLLRLVDAHSDPDAPLERALAGVAPLFAAEVEDVGGARRLRDAAGATIALAAALTPGRERPCEVVTVPLVTDHERSLERLLAPARELGFTVPHEAAVHLHVDAAPFRGARAFGNLVRLFGHWREHLRVALGTNAACTRLQPLPPALLELDDEQPWAALRGAAAATGLTKYYDVNLTALLTDRPRRDTVEVRILPGTLHPAEITARAHLLEALLDRCERPLPLPRPRGEAPPDAARAGAELLSLARAG